MNTENDICVKNKDIDFYIFFEIKAEKLVTAVYMITNFLSDKEPMKWKLRDSCLSMLSKATVLKGKSDQERSDILVNILNLIKEVLSLLEIAHLSGFISEMNYLVLKREYVFIKKQIESREEIKNSLGRFSFSESFFETGQVALPTGNISTEETYQPNSLPRSLSDENKQNFIKPKEAYLKQKDIVMSDKIKDNISVHSKNENVRPLSASNGAKEKRREIIIQSLKDKKELTIKDISLKITNCSEKTIQRELVSMLREGVLKKMGERRWSRYSLA